MVVPWAEHVKSRAGHKKVKLGGGTSRLSGIDIKKNSLSLPHQPVHPTTFAGQPRYIVIPIVSIGPIPPDKKAGNLTEESSMFKPLGRGRTSAHPRRPFSVMP